MYSTVASPCSSLCVYFRSSKYHDASNHLLFHGTAVISSVNCLQGEPTWVKCQEIYDVINVNYVSLSHVPNETKYI